MNGDVNRRSLMKLIGAGSVGILCQSKSIAATDSAVGRVIIDNDFAGDPDGLFQMAQQALCPSVRIPLVISSHLPGGFAGPLSSADGAKKVSDLMRLMKIVETPQIVAGAEVAIMDRSTPPTTAASAAIVREAMRTGKPPLTYAAGAGLTDLASAWLQEPRIGPKIRLIWIGGSEHAGLGYPPPGPAEAEFNFNLDRSAAQIVFNESDIEIWQVPRNVYRQMLFSNAELNELASSNKLAAFLQGELRRTAEVMAKIPGLPPLPTTEAYILGDSPLVTLTALLPPFQPDPSSSRYVVMPTPTLRPDGSYLAQTKSRPMRVYTQLDADLTFRDMVSRFRRWQRAND